MRLRNAIPLELDGAQGDLAPLATLDRISDEAQFAFVVEMDHFIREKSEFRLMCIRYLAWSVVRADAGGRASAR